MSITAIPAIDEKGFADAVESAGTRIVRVDARRRFPSTGTLWSDEVIVTASHAIERDEQIEVVRGDGSAVAAQLVGRDPSTDLAVLKIEPAPSKVQAPWASLEGVRVGQLVLALARPGRTVQATLGIISALGDSFRTPGGGRVARYLETDADLRRGFSGGPLIDPKGRVLGMVTSGLVRGANLVIPTATVARIVESLLEEGRIRRAFLGITSFAVRLPPALEQEIGQPSGLLVHSVQPGGPADRAGLLLGDVLVGLDGHRLTDVGDLFELLEEERIDKALPVKLIRAGKVEDRTISPSARGGEQT